MVSGFLSFFFESKSKHSGRNIFEVQSQHNHLDKALLGDDGG